MPLHFFPIYFLHYLLKRQANLFFASIAIRSLALGMVLIFEPIYLYLYFNSLPLTLLFYAASHGLFALLATSAARLIAKIGLRQVILFSHFFFFGYFLCLFFLNESFIFVPLAILIKATALVLFWPAFHIDFTRFSEKGYQGRAVSKMNIVFSLPTVISPFIGGAILGIAGYPALFIAVLAVLLASSIPMFISKETHIVYQDSFRGAWQRIFKKGNRRISLALAAENFEIGICSYLWPLFMFILAIGYATMGGITTLALGITAIFSLYMGRMCDTLSNRIWFLNIGAVLTSIAWVIKYFVRTPFDAFLAHTLYSISRKSASIPFQTFLYNKASLKGAEMDEFIIYREIAINAFRLFGFIILAAVFFFIPQINIAFLIAAVMSLGLTLIGIPPKFRW